MAKSRYLNLGFGFQFIVLWRDFWSIRVIKDYSTWEYIFYLNLTTLNFLVPKRQKVGTNVGIVKKVETLAILNVEELKWARIA